MMSLVSLKWFLLLLKPLQETSTRGHCLSRSGRWFGQTFYNFIKKKWRDVKCERFLGSVDVTSTVTEEMDFFCLYFSKNSWIWCKHFTVFTRKRKKMSQRPDSGPTLTGSTAAGSFDLWPLSPEPPEMPYKKHRCNVRAVSSVGGLTSMCVCVCALMLSQTLHCDIHTYIHTHIHTYVHIASVSSRSRWSDVVRDSGRGSHQTGDVGVFPCCDHRLFNSIYIWNL